MRKTVLTNKTVKKAITIAMAFVISASTAMSSVATINVYAEEGSEVTPIEETTTELVEEAVEEPATESVTAPAAEQVTTTDVITSTVENEDGSQTTVETTTETTTTTDENIDATENGVVTENVTENENGEEIPVINDGGTEFYVDGTQVSDEETAKAAGQQDYVVKEQVIDEEATQINHYIVDAEGNYVLDENEEKIAVEDGTKIEQIEVIKKKDVSSQETQSEEAQPATEKMPKEEPQMSEQSQASAAPEVILEKVDEEDIVYVKENENGVKELVDADTEGAEEYVEVEDGEAYEDSVTINELTITDAEGNETKQFVDDDLAKLLDDDEATTSENYSIETVYTVTVKDNEGNDCQVEVRDSELADGDNLEVNEEDGSVKVSVEEKKTYTFQGKDGKTYTADQKDLQIEKKGNKYFAVSSEGTTVEVKKKTETTESISYETTLGGTTYQVDPENVKTEVRYEVYAVNENGEEELVMELTKEQYENREVASKDYAKVEDAYIVYDAKGNETATFTEEEWKVITEAEVTYKEVTKMYYTTEANYIEASFGTKGNELKLGENYYKLDVKLFENTDGITYGEPTCAIDEATAEAVVSVPYTLKDGKAGTFTRRIALTEFGSSNYATVEIKYVPTYTNKTEYDFTVDVKRNTTETVVSVKTETVTKTTTTITSNSGAGTTEENPIKANSGEAINEAGTNNHKAEHIDIRFNVNISDKLKELGVKNAKVEDAQVIINRNEKYVASQIRQEKYGVYEYNFSKGKAGQHFHEKDEKQHQGNNGEGNSGFQGNQLVTVLAKISYQLNGETKTLWYATTLYPDINSDLNVCNGTGNALGFDYEVSLEEINAAIEEQIITSSTVTDMVKTDSVKMEIGTEVALTESEIKKVIESSVDNGEQKVTENLIHALVFVRLDGVEQEENGKTHYPTSEYSKELAKGQVILLYAPNGYKVYGEIGDETVYGRILKWVEDGTESKMDDIEKAYLDNLTEEEKELLKNRVELEVKQQIEEQKESVAKELLGENYTEEAFESIIWTLSEEETQKAIDEVLSDLDVRWYVLKDEADGSHIDGVIITKKADVKVEGKLPVVPMPTATPTVAPTATPTTEPTVAPTAEPTVAPTAEPTVAPTVAPTAEPTATPTAAPTVAPTATPTVAPTAAPTVAPTVAPTATPTVAPTTAPTVEPTVAPTAAPTVAPTAEPTVAPTATPVVIIEDPQVPLADGPAFTAPVAEDTAVENIEPVTIAQAVVAQAPITESAVEEAAVLGARRAEEDAAVLGANRGTEKAVLGKRRRPQTGDSMALTVWMGIMVMSTGLAGVSGAKLTKNKKKKEVND